MDIFETESIAGAYSKDRPFFHPIVIDKICSYLGMTAPLDNCLDVGCGAGLSSIALKDKCKHVVGIDSSREMIASAIKHDDISYFPYAAEDIPLKQKFDLVTLSGSIDWVDRPKFLSGIRKLLTPGGHIAIYDNDFTGIMENSPGFTEWYTAFSKKYPRPPRNSSPLDKQEVKDHGFELINEETYTNVIEYTKPDFINYLFTLSNITVALKTTDDDSIREVLAASLEPFFKDVKRELVYGGYIWYLKSLA